MAAPATLSRSLPTPLPDLAPPAWFAFRYSLPEPAVRAAVWRTLKDLEAVNVQRSVWAVRDDTEHRERIARLAERIRSGGGHSSVEAVTGGSTDELLLHSRLHRACERLWDDLYTLLDGYETRAARRDWSTVERVTALAHVHALFATTAGTDLVGSDAGPRAEARLHRAVDELITTGVDPVAWCRDQPGRRRAVEVVSSFPRTDGTRHHVAVVHPAVDPLWGAAFERFEATTYRPSPDRVPLRATTFQWTAAPGTEREALAALEARVACVEAWLT